MISDASYCEISKKAGIGVVDAHSGEKYSTILLNVENSTVAEFVALVYSVKIALKNKYKNVVFVYDCMFLDIANLEKYIEGKFMYAQFLWLKRDFTSEADKLARKALTLAKSLTSLNIKSSDQLKKERTLIIKRFSNYDYKQIIKACIYAANRIEYEVLNIFLNGNYDIYKLPEFKSTNTQLYKFIYHMLPIEKRDRFYGFIISINPIILSQKKFKSRPSNVILVDKLVSIMSKIKKSRVIV